MNLGSTQMSTRAATAWVVALTGIGSLMAALDTLVVSTALSTIRLDLGASVEQLEWTVNAYNLSFAVLLITGAALGDRYGRRKLFAAGLGLFAVASAACALAPDVGWLIAARAVQGAGAALLMPLGLALLSAAFPPEKRGAAIGIFSAITGVAVASGPLVGGLVVEGISWEWIFWLNVPIGLLAIPFVLTRMKESFGPDTNLDIPGLGLVSAGALGIVWGLVRGNQAGWASAEVVGSLAVGALLVAVFVAWERRAREPMLPMHFFRSRAFSAGNTAIFFTFASLFGAVFFYAQLLQTTMGYSPLDAGLRLLPWTATFITVAPIAGALADRIGERPLMVSGLLAAGGRDGLAGVDRRARPCLFRVARTLHRRRRRCFVGDSGSSELGCRRVGNRGDRQGSGCQQHDARARRRLRNSARRRRLRRGGELRLGGGVHRRIRGGDRRGGRTVACGGDRRPGAARPPRAPSGVDRAVPAFEVGRGELRPMPSSDHRRVIVRYKVKPDRVAENEELVRAVYDELASRPGHRAAVRDVQAGRRRQLRPPRVDRDRGRPEPARGRAGVQAVSGGDRRPVRRGAGRHRAAAKSARTASSPT